MIVHSSNVDYHWYLIHIFKARVIRAYFCIPIYIVFFWYTLTYVGAWICIEEEEWLKEKSAEC